MQAGKNRHEDICESIELFGREVLPEFKDRDEAQVKAKADRLAPVVEAAMARKARRATTHRRCRRATRSRPSRAAWSMPPTARKAARCSTSSRPARPSATATGLGISDEDAHRARERQRAARRWGLGAQPPASTAFWGSSVNDLAGKVALVTGGASGIGAATAQRLADEGCRVVIADVQADAGAKHAADIGGRFIALDVSDAAAWTAAIADVVATEGSLDIVHLNAGVTTGEGDITKLTDAQYDRIIGANVNGVLYGARAAATAMAGRGGAIVATASVAGLIGFSPDPIYTLTKHAVVGLVRALGPALAPQCVTVNAICPGVVDTPLVGEARQLLAAAGYP